MGTPARGRNVQESGGGGGPQPWPSMAKPSLVRLGEPNGGRRPSNPSAETATSAHAGVATKVTARDVGDRDEHDAWGGRPADLRRGRTPPTGVDELAPPRAGSTTPLTVGCARSPVFPRPRSRGAQPKRDAPGRGRHKEDGKKKKTVTRPRPLRGGSGTATDILQTSREDY